jgi:hypothetical protein
MIIIWRGLGFLVFGIVLVCMVLGKLIFDGFLGEGYFDYHRWPLALCLIISAASCWTLGNYLQAHAEAKDEKTGGDSSDHWPRHTLFFIPMHYWAPILLVIALGLVLR